MKAIIKRLCEAWVIPATLLVTTLVWGYSTLHYAHSALQYIHATITLT